MARIEEITKEDIRVIKERDGYSVLDAYRNRQRAHMNVKCVEGHYALFSDVSENPLRYTCNSELIGIVHTEAAADGRLKTLAENWAEYLRLNPPKPDNYNL